MSCAEVINFEPMSEDHSKAEGGFTKLDNELFEAILSANLSHSQQSVLLAMIRKTDGYQKKTDDISARQIGDMCSMSRQHVTKALNDLAKYNVITKKPGKHGSIVGIQKNHKNWNLPEITKRKASPKFGQVSQIRTGEPEQDTPCPKAGQVDSPILGHTKENLPKENKQKKGRAKNAIALSTFLSACKESGERPVRDYKPLWDFAEPVGLPEDFIALAWAGFCRRFSNGGTHASKRQKDWRQTFRNYVENNYLGLWWLTDDGEYQLTSKGRQAEMLTTSEGAK